MISNRTMFTQKSKGVVTKHTSCAADQTGLRLTVINSLPIREIMSKGTGRSQQFLIRIRQQLDALPISKQQSDEVALKLLRYADLINTNFGQSHSGHLPSDSVFFDFAGKLQTVVAHFHDQALTPAVYCRAAVKQPSLFYLSPATAIANIEGAARHFREQGMTLPEYLRAAIKHPPLFYQSPTTIVTNITAVADHFRDQGLTLPKYVGAALKQPSLFSLSPYTAISNIETVAEHFCEQGLTVADYLRAALKQPPLFFLSPYTVVANIEAVAGHFRQQGLTLADYLRAALKQPSLFYGSPATVIANITTVTDHYCDQGLRRGAYLRAALKLPQLFCQSPATVIRHVSHLINLHSQGFITFPGDADSPCAPPLKPMFDYLVKRPMLFCLADDNYTLREAYARRSGKRFRGTYLLTRPRHKIEKQLAALGPLPARGVPHPK